MTTAQQESVPSMAQSAYLAVREGIIHGIYKPVAEGRAGDTLREVVAEAYRATLAEDADAIRQANTQFHAETIAMTGNSLLIATMAPLLGRIRWLFALTADRDPHVEYGEHVTLCDAIYSANPDLAGALAFAHIEHGRAPSLAGLAGVLPAV